MQEDNTYPPVEVVRNVIVVFVTEGGGNVALLPPVASTLVR
jgi:hypothetical protein